MVAATLYLACQKSNDPRTLEEIAQACDVDRNEVEVGYHYLKKALKVNGEIRLNLKIYGSKK
jgi:transcription initiation factor TFIIIB Brf1 subunit/transcription initiation factor TFIIB